MWFLQFMLWAVYFLAVLAKFSHSAASGLFSICIYLFEIYLWYLICSRYYNYSRQRNVLVRHMALLIVTWALILKLIIASVIFGMGTYFLVQVLLGEKVSPLQPFFIPLRNLMLRVYGVWFGMWGYQRLRQARGVLKIQHIVAYSLSGDIGFHLTSRFFEIGHFESIFATALASLKIFSDNGARGLAPLV